MYKALFTRKAEKELDKLARHDAKRVVKKLQKLTYPFPKNMDIRKLKGTEGFYRLRVGKLRVIFEVDSQQEEIWIRKAGYRGGFYK